MKFGVTGPIAAGKSSVSGILCEYFDVDVVDADSICRDVVENDGALCEAIAARLGNEKILGKHGLDRSLTAEIVFSDPRKLQILNLLVHPPMLKEIRSRIQRSRSPHLLVDAALLFDWDIQYELDGILLITADESLRVKRLFEKGFSEKDARSRMATQTNWEEKEKICRWTIRNNGTLSELRQKVMKWWEKVSQAGEASSTINEINAEDAKDT